MILLTLQAARDWLAAVRTFDGTYKATVDNLGALAKLQSAVRAWPPDLQREYTVTVRKGLAAKAKLDALRATRDKVRAWVASLGSALRSTLGLDALDALPLVFVGVGLAAFLAGLAAARGFLTDAHGLAKRVNIFEAERARLRAEGVPPDEASARASSTAKDLAGEAGAPGVLERLGNKGLWIGGTVLVLAFVVPKLLEQVRARR